VVPESGLKMAPPLGQVIRTIRGKRVILDADLAAIYGVPTKSLNQAVRIQIVAEPMQPVNYKNFATNRSQSLAGLTQPSRQSSVAPFAFTEHGALMAANLLRSPKAVQVGIYVVRAFGRQRELLMGQAEILKRLAEIDAQLLGHDKALLAIWREIQPLLHPPPPPEKPEIGFHVREDAPAYRAGKRRIRP
jgi:hypothetical protein